MRIWITLFTLLTLSACLPFTGKSGLNYGLPAKVTNSAALAQLSTALNSKCIECHAWINDPSSLLANGRIVPGNPEGSILFQLVKSGQMPQTGPGLTNAELEELRGYILALTQGGTLPPTPIEPDAPDTEEFADLKTAFVGKKCIVCHKGMVSEPEFKKGLVPGNPEESKIFQSITSGSMPKQIPAATAAEVELVADYVHGVGETNPKVDFALLTSQLLKSKCLICHKGWTEEKRVLKYVVAGDLQKSKLYRSVSEGWMPQRPKAVDANDLQLLRDYILQLKPAAATRP